MTVRNTMRIILLPAFVALALCSCKGKETESTLSSGINGPIPDTVLYTVTDDFTAAVQSVIDGKHDMCLNTITRKMLNSLSESDRNKLDIYSSTGNVRSLLLNPVPNAPPYTVTLPGTDAVFNPFAMQEIRYALNWLINRRRIIDTVFSGDGHPMFTAVIPEQPGSDRYTALPPKLGMTETGDEQRALSNIHNAMIKAARLPENKGLLLNRDGRWFYNQKPVSVKLITRNDDPDAAPIGRYIETLLEKAGFTVENRAYDSARAFAAVYASDPASYQWSMYTEYWGTSSTRRWWEDVTAQMYAPFENNMPGGGHYGNWNYTNDLLDRLSKKLVYGDYLHTAGYWHACLEVTKLGLLESVRIYLLAEQTYFIARKDRFLRRSIYGISDGINHWSIRTADIKPDTTGMYAGQKVLRTIYWDPAGMLFRSPWDPVGAGGFNDALSIIVANASNDAEISEAPHDARTISLLSYYDPDSFVVKPKLNSKGHIGGLLTVPPEAEKYNSRTKSWEPVPSGQTAAGTATGRLRQGYYWHNGCPITIADVRYGNAFDREWSSKDSPDDPYFDPLLAEERSLFFDVYQGSVFHPDGAVTNYANYYFAPDSNKTASVIGGLSVKTRVSDLKLMVPWEIYEAISEIVAHGAHSKTVYSFSDIDPTAEYIDLINPICVADIRFQLKRFIADKHIPLPLAGIISLEDALQRYQTSIDFIDKHNHAYISNGPFFVDSIDFTGTVAAAKAVRTYPYDSWQWHLSFSQKKTLIQSITAPQTVEKTSDAVYDIKVLQCTYPETDYKPLSEGTVTLILWHEDGSESTYQAQMLKDGLFRAVIPARDIAKLLQGLPYTLTVTSFIADELPSIKTLHLMLQ